MTTLKRYHEEALRNKPGQYQGKKQYLLDSNGQWYDDRRRRPSGRKKARQSKEEVATFYLRKKGRKVGNWFKDSREGRETILRHPEELLITGFIYKGEIFHYQHRKEQAMPTENPKTSIEFTRDEWLFVFKLIGDMSNEKAVRETNVAERFTDQVSKIKQHLYDRIQECESLPLSSNEHKFSFETPQAPTKIGGEDIYYVADGGIRVGCARLTAEQIDLMHEKSLTMRIDKVVDGDEV